MYHFLVERESSGSGIEHHSKGQMESELEVGEACDFAYRLREFIYIRATKKLKDKGDYSNSSMFGQGEAPAPALSEAEVFPQFLHLEDQDIEVPGIFTIAISDEISPSLA